MQHYFISTLKLQMGRFKKIDVQHEIIKLHCINEFQFHNKDIARTDKYLSQWTFRQLVIQSQMLPH